MIAQRRVQFKDSYDLKRTIESGQAFHWIPSGESSWETAWRGFYVGVKQVSPSELVFATNSAETDTLSQITDYFQCHMVDFRFKRFKYDGRYMD